MTELPDPFLFLDGSRVKTREDWRRRRAELQELFFRYEYGHPPMSFTAVTAMEISRTDDAQLHATVTKVTLRLGGDGGLTVPLVLTTPIGSGPFPVIVGADLVTGPSKPQVMEKVIARGYAACEFDRASFAPDSSERKRAAYSLDPSADCGAIAAWAWGYSRVIDYVVTRALFHRGGLPGAARFCRRGAVGEESGCQF